MVPMSPICKIVLTSQLIERFRMADEKQNLPPKRPAADVAERALTEARQRQVEIDRRTSEAPVEKGGRGGLDPNRYGDWEIKGLTSDF